MIYELFQHIAQANPERIAVVQEQRRLTYGDLLNRVQALSLRLCIDYGVGQDVLVPLFLTRSFDMLIAILAVMAAGGICMPLDPDHPVEHIQLILEDSQAGLLVTNLDIDSDLRQGHNVIDLREYAEVSSSNSLTKLTTLPQIQPSAQDCDRLIYCFYTSGSTGRPKGVLLRETGIVNVLNWARNYFAIQTDDVILLSTTFTFDISILELFLPLTSGALLVLLQPGDERSPIAINAAIVKNHVTTIQFTPSGLVTYLSVLGTDPLPGVTRCLCAKELLKPALRDEFYAKVFSAHLYNLYGPTETTIYATAALVPRTGPITVGVPLTGNWVEVVDERGEKVPHGEVGELWIGGAGESRGYLNRADLTVKRFRESVAGRSGWCYRSGDLGKWLPNGEINVLGRTDYQVKICGYRIELGEIEASLMAFEGVKDAVVVSREINGDVTLVAYFIGTAEQQTLIAGLRRTLPKYMIPARFMHLESFPLTASGKVQRSQLPLPDFNSVPDIGDLMPPTNSTEEALCQIFANILGWHCVGTSDRFLDLGGDILKAIRIAFLIRQQLSQDLPIELLLRNQTIAEIAAMLEQNEDAAARIAVAPNMEWYPLASGQRALWLLERAGVRHAAYVETLCYELSGKLDTAALYKAVESLLERHESLRMAIREIDGVPKQRPVPPRLDWMQTKADDSAAAQTIISQFVERDFDLTSGDLLRTLLIRLAPEKHIFTIAIHHIACDSWSFTLIIDQIFSAYNTFKHGLSPQAVCLGIQYKDFCYWQQSRLKTVTTAKARSYWLQKLSGDVEILDLSTDRPRPGIRTFQGRTLLRNFSTQSLNALKQLCHKEQVTLYTGLCAALRALFYRLTEQSDFILGTTTLGRPVPELAEQIGHYTNVVALRDQVTPTMTFRELLTATATTLLKAMEHDAYPFDELVTDLKCTTGSKRNPLFEVMVQLDPGRGDFSKKLDGIKVSRLIPPINYSKFDLTLFFRETSQGLELLAEFSTAIFDIDRLERMLAQLETLLQSATATPDAEICELLLLPIAEQELVLKKFNDTLVNYNLSTPIHQLFELQVARTPQRLATVDEYEQLTYAALNERANVLADMLRCDHGVGPNVIVALLMERSVQLIVAILGILKAGGAYLPLNPKDPRERLHTILSDSSPAVTLLNADWAQQQLGDTVPIVDLRQHIHGSPENPGCIATGNDAIYCIYTSGSTGIPNGVVVEHSAVANRLFWMIDDLSITQEDVILQKTSYSFDVSVWEIFLPLIVGAKQIMLRPGSESDPAVIKSVIETHQTTLVHFVPAMLNQYLSVVEAGFKGVRHCVCSGEALDRDLANRFLSTVGDAGTQLHNYYGPTEATVDVSRCRVEIGSDPVTIGHPAPNNRFYVLDARRHPCPIGVTGDLYIAGIQLGRGYLNRPQLNAERYVNDPFHPGEQMYLTGDLARWLPSGEIYYLGRKDSQVKLRGFRIDLGEIEHALISCKGVDNAVVLKHHHSESGDYLCGYITSTSFPSEPKLRESMAVRLPEYMIPAHFIYLEAFPVTRNGKVDRKALATMPRNFTTVQDCVPPSGQAEAELLAIWHSLLPSTTLNFTNDFFKVGGNSLAAVQLAARIMKKFGVSMRVAEIFRNRTIREQVRLIEAKWQNPTEPKLTLSAHPRKSRHRVSPAQERMWLFYILEPDSSAYNIRFQGLLTGEINTYAFQAAINELVSRHEVLRTTYISQDGQIYQVPHKDLPTLLEIRDLSGIANAGKQIPSQAEELVNCPFRLETEMPVRFVLFRASATEHTFLIVLHHIAGDAWSMRVLLHELSLLYELKLKGASATLPQLPLQYIDYSESLAQLEYAPTIIMKNLNYWRERLRNCPLLDLPTDLPLPESASSPSVFSFVLPKETTESIKQLAKSTSTTAFEVIMAALNLLLFRLSNQQDIVVGFPMANRHFPGLESVVGLFLSALALRTDLSGDPTFTQLLARVSAGIHEAYEHQHIPFEQVVQEVNPVRRLNRTPIFDVLLNYQSGLEKKFHIKGVNVKVITNDLEIAAKYLLTVYVSEENGGLRFELVPRTDLFSPMRSSKMLSQLRAILEQVVQSPQARCSTFSLLDKSERAATIAEISAPIEKSEKRMVIETILAWAATDGESIALEQSDVHITYAELAHRIQILACSLVANGCRPGETVALSGSRGIGFVVGMLAILRCGAVVLPVNPALPNLRRQQILTIGKPMRAVLVYERNDLQLAADFQDIPRLLIEAKSGVPIQQSASTKSVELPSVQSSGAAYIFFTSGTTGAPRGVLGWHGALTHFLEWQQQTFAILATDRCSQTTSVSFDVMLRDTLLALVSGGTVVIPQSQDELGGAAVFPWLDKKKITLLHTVPTVFHTWLLDAPEYVRLDALHSLFFAGEPLRASLVKSIRTRFPGIKRIVNLYGPTETTMAKFAYEIPHTPLPDVLPVGKPLPQCQGFVMRGDAFCSVGEPGEIVIRTPFSTLGYLDGQVNVSGFIQNPYTKTTDDIIYRTGDFGRWRPDGMLEVLGRIDDEIKINGVRIQPAEVEKVLSGHPLVYACTVIPFKEPNSEPRLVAYVVSKDTNPNFTEQIRTYVSQRLPQALVPGQFIRINVLPMTANGKIDRAALPSPLSISNSEARKSELPSTSIQKEIASIWAEVLEHPVFGTSDNFFELGGTSLKLLRLHHCLNLRFPDMIRVAQLFSSPTIAEQAQLIESDAAEQLYDEVTVHEL